MAATAARIAGISGAAVEELGADGRLRLRVDSLAMKLDLTLPSFDPAFLAFLVHSLPSLLSDLLGVFFASAEPHNDVE